MSQIMEMLMSQLGGDALGKISEQIGADKGSTEKGLMSAIPLLTGAMDRNTNDDEGAQSLAGALERDHDGSIFDNLEGFLSNPGQANGSGILGHVLGQKRPMVEKGISKGTGMDGGSVSQLLEIAAPLLMGALGKQKREKNLDPQQLSSHLSSELKQQEQQQPDLVNMAVNMLDADGDGSVIDDIMGMAGGLFGKK